MAVPNPTVHFEFQGNSTESVAANNGTDTSISYSTGDGVIGQGANFAAGSSLIALPDVAAFKPTGSFTINFWLKTTFSGPTKGVFQSSNASNRGVMIQMTSGEINCDIFDSAGANYGFNTSGAALNNGVKHMLSLITNGSTVALYKDANSTPIASVAMTSSTAYGSPNYVGFGAFTNNGTWSRNATMSYDQFDIFPIALSTADLGLLYNGGAGLAYPYTASGPANLKTLNGLALASIKTINGLAIASVKSVNGLT